MIRAFFVSIVLIVLGLAVYAGWIEPRSLVLRHIDIGEGERTIRIELLSDLHAGGFHMSADRVGSIVASVNAQQPDIVLMPGDFVDGHLRKAERDIEDVRLIEAALSRLSTLSAPTIATTGNHDSWYGRVAIKRLLTAADVSVIDNSSISQLGLCVVGFADFDTDRPTADGFADCEAGQPRLVLMHSPDARYLLPDNVALVVAGHTHGGQVNLPILGRRVTSTRCGEPCAYGLIESDPPFLVTAGLGTSILPIRFRSPPEIVIITLRLD